MAERAPWERPEDVVEERAPWERPSEPMPAPKSELRTAPQPTSDRVVNQPPQKILETLPDKYYIENREPSFIDKMWDTARKYAPHKVDQMQRDLQGVDDLVRTVARGMTFGWADKAVGAIEGTGGESERARTMEAKARLPGILGPAAELGGSAVTTGGLAKLAPTAFGAAPGQSVLSRILTGTGSGAAIGAAQSAADDESVLHGAASGAIAGGIVAPALGAVVRSGVRFANRMVGNTAPSIEALEEAATNVAKQASAQGVVVSQGAWNTAVNDVISAARAAGYDKGINGRAVTTVLNKFDQARGKTLSLDGVENMRKMINNAVKATPNDDRASKEVLFEMKGALDQWGEGLRQGDVYSGNAQNAVGMFKEMRKTWASRRKMELLQDAFDQADNSAQPYDSAIRTSMRKIANRKDFKTRWTKPEQAAIKDIVQGDSIGSLMGSLGRLGSLAIAPTGLGSMAGYYIAGPPGALIGGVTGAAGAIGAQKVSGEMARGATRDLSYLVGTGQHAPGVGAASTLGRALGIPAAAAKLNDYLQPRKK